MLAQYYFLLNILKLLRPNVCGEETLFCVPRTMSLWQSRYFLFRQGAVPVYLRCTYESFKGQVYLLPHFFGVNRMNFLPQGGMATTKVDYGKNR